LFNELTEAELIADRVIAQLRPHCERIDIAGSIRRRRPTIGDIEIVCIPKPYQAEPLFASGLATVVNQWPKVLGELPCKYTKRRLPEGINLDLFMVDPKGFGLQLAIRTGSADWCRKVLAPAWVQAGYQSKDGVLRHRVDEDFPDNCDITVSTPTEQGLFDLIGLPWTPPEQREVQP